MCQNSYEGFMQKIGFSAKAYWSQSCWQSCVIIGTWKKEWHVERVLTIFGFQKLLSLVFHIVVFMIFSLQQNFTYLFTLWHTEQGKKTATYYQSLRVDFVMYNQVKSFSFSAPSDFHSTPDVLQLKACNGNKLCNFLIRWLDHLIFCLLVYLVQDFSDKCKLDFLITF